MAVCRYCKREMLGAKTCNPFPVRIGKVEYLRIPYGQMPGDSEFNLPDTCHDCGVEKGNYHHPGCDMEVCPKCGGQIISCGCKIMIRQ